MAAIKALVKPELLAWTRSRARVAIEDAAKAANVTTDRIRQWEAGEEAPTVAQLRCLAEKYHFPLAVFYLPGPPADFQPLRDFRRLPDYQLEPISANLAFHIKNAHERREIALELYQDSDTSPARFSLKATLNDEPEVIGEKIRKFLGVDEKSQKEASSNKRAFDYWRRKMEEHDILVFVVSGPHYSVSLQEMRGFAIAKPELPAIVVNGKDPSQGGKAFTLLHELTHVVLGESAISNGATEELVSSPEEQNIERFCDQVAAAAIMPRQMMLSMAGSANSAERQWSDSELRAMSNAIGASREAVLLRLVTLRRATWKFYMEQRPRFLEEYRKAAEEKSQKEVKIKRPTWLMLWNGRGYTRIVLRSYHDRRITLNDASSYLGAKVKHIPALELATFSSPGVS